MYHKFHCALVLISLAGLAACAPAPGKGIPAASATLLPSPSPTATITPLAWEGEKLPGVDHGLSGELFTLPQDVFAALREKGGAPIELTNGVVGGVSNGLCSVAIAEQLTTGSQLQADGEGPAVYAFDGQKDQLAFWQNLPVPEGVKCAAFVAQDGNAWGLEPGTVGVWFFTGGGKAGSTVINADNPLRVMISADNSAKFAFTNSQLTMTTLSASGQIIEEQKIAFLPPLPADFLSQVPKDSYTYDANGLHITVAEGRVIDIPQNEIADKLVIGVFDNPQILGAEQYAAPGHRYRRGSPPFRALTGATVKDSYLVLRSKYQLNILGSLPGLLPRPLELALLDWLWSRPDGIGYLCVPLNRTPPVGKPGPFDRWLASLEMLSRLFPGWVSLAQGSVEWLWAQRNELGFWDFGPRPSPPSYFPLSDSWRTKQERIFDWTTRILVLLRRYDEDCELT